MIVGDRNSNILNSNADIDSGVSNIELSQKSSLSNKEMDDLIGALCEARKENNDVMLMDQIKKGNYNNIPFNPIELEKINEQKEYDAVEADIIEGLMDNPEMSIDEANMMKVNGFYDKYVKIKESKGDIDVMESIEKEIQNEMRNDDIINESETVENNSFPETNMDIVEDNNIIDTEENSETVNSEEEYKPMSTEEFNDVPASELKVDDDDIKSKLKETYSNIDDQDTIDLLNVMKRYQSGEKFNVYEALPKSVRVEIDKAAMESGVTDRSIINFFAKNFINDLISDTYIGKEIDDFQNELSSLTSSMDNIPGLIIDTYTDDLKEKFEKNMLEIADKIQDEDSDKADRLRRIASNFKSSYTLDKIKKSYENKPSLLNRAYKRGRDNYNSIKIEFNEKFKDTKPRVKTFESINNAIMYKLGYSEDYAKAFSVLVYDSIMSENDNSLESHIYAYYIMLGFININLTANNSELMIEFCHNIHDIMVDIERYMSNLNISKKKKKGKNNGR